MFEVEVKVTFNFQLLTELDQTKLNQKLLNQKGGKICESLIS